MWSVPPTRGDRPEAYLEDPLSPLGARCVMWGAGKGGVNGDGTGELVVLYSTSLSDAGACNTAVVPLGCSEQAKGVCYYVLKSDCLGNHEGAGLPSYFTHGSPPFHS